MIHDLQTGRAYPNRACCLAMPGIRKLGESRDLIITGGPLERAWQQGDTQTMQVWSANVSRKHQIL
jgi:hypothetical protein